MKKVASSWAVRFSGNANNGSNAGLAYANSNNSAANTNANSSSQLCNNINIRGRTLSLDKKYILKRMLVIQYERFLQTAKPITMKRVNYLFYKVCSIENLNLADKKARRKKKNTYGIRVHDKNREENIAPLHKTLLNGEFKTSEYDIFTIRKTKERVIYRLPYYPDRIVHHAIMNVVEPIWVSVFTTDTYSCIKKRGIHKCAKNIKKALHTDRNNTRYCLKLDVKKFYPSINYNILKEIIRKKIKDNKLLSLLDEIIDSAEGVPIGNYLSQYFANLYLAYFDHWLKEIKKVNHYFRYADDMILLHNNKEYLHQLRKDIDTYLENNLNLKLKGNYSILPSRTGIDAVGYVFYPTYTLLRKSTKQKMMRIITKHYKRNTITTDVFKRKIAAYWGWCKHCNSINLINKINQKYNTQINFKR